MVTHVQHLDVKTMKAVKTKKACITHCDMCNGKTNYVYPITEILYGEIIGLMVCSDCNELHQRELEWNIQKQLNNESTERI